MQQWKKQYYRILEWSLLWFYVDMNSLQLHVISTSLIWLYYHKVIGMYYVLLLETGIILSGIQ